MPKRAFLLDVNEDGEPVVYVAVTHSNQLVGVSGIREDIEGRAESLGAMVSVEAITATESEATPSDGAEIERLTGVINGMHKEVADACRERDAAQEESVGLRSRAREAEAERDRHREALESDDVALSVCKAFAGCVDDETGKVNPLAAVSAVQQALRTALAGSSAPSVEGDGEAQRDADGQRLYVLLALFDRRDGSYRSQLVQAAREGWERSHPDMGERDAWAPFDRLWADGKATEEDDAELRCKACGSKVQWHPASDDFGVCSECGEDNSPDDAEPPAAGVQSTTETTREYVIEPDGDDRLEAIAEAIMEVAPLLAPECGMAVAVSYKDGAVRLRWTEVRPSTTETATHHDYSLLDAVLPAEGARRDELIARMQHGLLGPSCTGRIVEHAYDALRAAVSSESEGNDERA